MRMQFPYQKRGSLISHPSYSLGKPCYRPQPKKVTLFSRTQKLQVLTGKSAYSVTAGTDMSYSIVECFEHKFRDQPIVVSSDQNEDCTEERLHGCKPMPSKYPRGTSHSVMTIGSRKDQDEYLQERLCKIPSAPPTLVIIEKIIESLVHSKAPAPKKGQAMPAIKGFTPLVLALPAVAKPSPRFIQKGSPVVPAIQGFDPLVLPTPIQGISRASSPKALEAALPNPAQSSLV